MKVRLGGEWKEISGAKTYANGAWRTIAAIKVYADGAWRDVANFTTPEPEVEGFTVSAPSSVYTFASLSTIRSSSVTATPSGGLAPYTYAWTLSAYVNVSIGAASRASTTFTATGMTAGEVRGRDASCTVTDALGSIVSFTIPLTFERA